MPAVEDLKVNIYRLCRRGCQRVSGYFISRIHSLRVEKSYARAVGLTHMRHMLNVHIYVNNVTIVIFIYRGYVG